MLRLTLRTCPLSARVPRRSEARRPATAAPPPWPNAVASGPPPAMSIPRGRGRALPKLMRLELSMLQLSDWLTFATQGGRRTPSGAAAESNARRLPRALASESGAIGLPEDGHISTQGTHRRAEVRTGLADARHRHRALVFCFEPGPAATAHASQNLGELGRI